MHDFLGLAFLFQIALLLHIHTLFCFIFNIAIHNYGTCFSTEEVTTSPSNPYWNAPHPHLAHLPQLAHPLSSNSGGNTTNAGVGTGNNAAQVGM